MKSVHVYLITFLCLFSLSETLYSQCLRGTTISLPNGNPNIAVCSDGGMPERIFVRPSTYATRYAYLITDANNVIVEVSNSPLLNLSHLPIGDFRVWGLSYGGVLTAAPGLDLDTDDLSDYCFELSSNYLTLVRGFVNGGRVQTTDADTDVTACVSNGIPDVVEFQTTGSSSGDYTYVVTDENNVVLSVITGNSIDFETTPAGVNRVWGLAYSGTLTVEVGDVLTEAVLSDACYKLSDNFVVVTKAAVNAGRVMMPNGNTQQLTCPSDGNPDIINFDSTGVVTSGNFTYVITDAQDNIVSFPTGDSMDFDGAGPGASRVYGLAYTGNLLARRGDNLLTAILSDQCYDVSENFIGVIRIIPNAGTIALADGGTEVTFCNTPDTVSFQVTGHTVIPPLAYILTDEENVILAVSTTNQLNFSNRQGTFRAYALSYTGTLTAEVGDNIDTDALSDDCFDVSNNFVTVTTANVEGGTVMLSNGETAQTICGGDENASILQFDSTGVSTTANFIYIITDENNVVISIPTADRVDANDIEAGISRVWGISYTGNLTVSIGDTLTSAELSDDCSDLSENFVTITRIDLASGTITLENGDSTTTTCTGDDRTDFVRFTVPGNDPDAPFRLVLTDANNRVLFFYNPNDTIIDFTGIFPDSYRIYSVSYTGTFIGQTEVNLSNAVFSDECYAITDNFVAVMALNISGGTVSLSNGDTITTVCIGDGRADVVEFDSTGVTSGVNYTYLVTDEDNIIVAIPSGDRVDFDGLDVGVSRVWGVAYTGELTVEVGDTASAAILADGCFALSSNFVTIVRTSIAGGTITLESGDDSATICTGDEVNDFVRFSITGNDPDAEFRIILADATDRILFFYNPNDTVLNFTDLFQNSYRIYSVSYTGTFTGQTEVNLNDAVLSDQCYSLSDNFVTIEALNLNGGIVSTVEDETEVSVCVGDGLADEISFQSTAVMNNDYTFLVTDTNNVIISLPAGNIINFDNAGSGTYRVYGLAYTGNIAASVGDIANTVALSDGCYLLSENFVTVTAFEPEAGRVLLISGSTDTTIIVDGNPDILQFTTTADTTGFNFTYIVTDVDNTILSIPSGNTIDFDSADLGVCRVWGFLYSGNLLATVGNPFSGILADGCFARSDNFVTIRKNEAPPCLADAGTLTATSATVPLTGATVTISATTNGNQFIPNGYEVLYILTSGSGSIIEAINNVPSFTVSDTGRYTIHTLVAELTDTSHLNYLDVSSIEFGVTTAADVTALIREGDLCADLDTIGATITVIEPEEVCLADAGTIRSDDATIVLNQATVTISATPNGNQVVPDGYEVRYVLTSGTNFVVLAISDEPSFEVSNIGFYRIHTLIAELSDTDDENYLDLSGIEFGVTTVANVVALIGELCADLDAVGAPVSIIEPLPCLADAGTLTAADSTVFLFGDSVRVSAIPNGDRGVPTGYEVMFILASGDVIEALSTAPNFAVTDTGTYTIHTLVAELSDAGDGDYLDLSTIEFGQTTVADLLDLIAERGICADLDDVGASIEVLPALPCLADAGTIVPEVDTAIFIPGMVLTVNATPQGFNVPVGYEIRYFIFRNGALIAPLPQASPTINIGNSTLVGTFSIHTVVAELSDTADVNYLDLSSFSSSTEPITLEEVIAFFNQVGVCADFAEEGATVEVVLAPEECEANAGTLGSNGDTLVLSTDTILVTAIANPDWVILPGYERVYILTSGTDFTIQAISNTPVFEVSEPGFYTIHTLVAELSDTANANYLDLSGLETIAEIENEIIATGICADVDVEGTSVTVILPDCLANAGSLRTEQAILTLNGLSVTISAESNDDILVPEGYEVLYILTSSQPPVIQAINDTATFAVSDTGLYTIHTLVAELSDTTDANYLDLSFITLGETIRQALSNIIANSPLCADFDAVGVQIQVVPAIELTPAEVFLIGGNTDTTLCIDGLADKLTFATNAVDTLNFSYIITDSSNHILHVLPGNMHDIDPMGAGTYRTWGVSYLGDLNVADIIYRETFDQDSVGIGGICPDSLFANCDLYNLPPANGQWTITTAAQANSVFLNNEDYFKTIGGVLEARDIDEEFCFLSSTIDISGRESVDFSVQITEIGDLEDLDYVHITLIVDTTEVPINNFMGLGDSNHTLTGDQPDDDDFGNIFVSKYGITGDSLRIRICVKNDAAAEQIRIDNVIVSECTVCGENLADANLSDGSYAVSSNFVAITGLAVNGGLVSLIGGATDTTVIISDDLSDILTFTTTVDTDAINFTYVVTNDQNTILAIPNGNMIDFDGVDIGSYRVWGLSYTGTLLAEEGDNATTTVLSDGCYALSDNFVSVIRGEGIICEAAAGSLSPAAGTYSLNMGTATISAVSLGDTLVPDGYEVRYLLTYRSIVLDINDAPVFIVDTTGVFTIHTLVAELDDSESANYFDSAEIEFGVTTIGEILNLIVANGICADFGVEGASVVVESESTTCIANAGSLTPTQTPVSLVGSGARISATPNGDAQASGGFDIRYLLTSGTNKVIQAIGIEPSFVVTTAGTYNIHTLVAEINDTRSEDYLDLSSVELGTTTILQIFELLVDRGVCGDIDVIGAAITVQMQPCRANAGTLTATQDTVQIVNGLATVSASPNGDAVVPNGYERVYIMTQGEDLTFVRIALSPTFSVMTPGTYTIHTLVAELSNPSDPNYLNPNNFMLGSTTAEDVLIFFDTTSICASLDLNGATVIVRREGGSIVNPDDVTARLTLGPNPATDVLQVILENDGLFNTTETVLLNVYNTNGQLVHSERIRVHDGHNQYPLQVFNFQSGMYIVHIQGEEHAISNQFIRTRL